MVKVKTHGQMKKYETSHDFSLSSAQLSDITDITHFKDAQSMYVIDFTDKEVVEGDVSTEKVSTHGQVVNEEELNHITQNLSLFSRDMNLRGGPGWPTHKTDVVFLLKEGGLDYYKAHGPENQFLERGDERGFHSFISGRPLKDFEQPGGVFVQKLTHGSGMDYLVDQNGHLYMRPMYFSYIEGNVHDGDYLLDEFAEHLLNNHEVAFYKDNRREERVYSKDNPKDEELSGIIKSIPYYNEEPGRTSFIEFIYYPSEPDIKKVLASECKDQYWELRKFVVNEVLGGKQFLVKPPEVELKTEVRRKFR